MYHFGEITKTDNIFTEKTTAKTAFLQHTSAVSSVNFCITQTHTHAQPTKIYDHSHTEFAYMWQLSLDLQWRDILNCYTNR
jgi:hypothetical protein